MFRRRKRYETDKFVHENRTVTHIPVHRCKEGRIIPVRLSVDELFISSPPLPVQISRVELVTTSHRRSFFRIDGWHERRRPAVFLFYFLIVWILKSWRRDRGRPTPTRWFPRARANLFHLLSQTLSLSLPHFHLWRADVSSIIYDRERVLSDVSLASLCNDNSWKFLFY